MLIALVFDSEETALRKQHAFSANDDVIHSDYDECLYHSERHELMLYLFISLMKLITNNVLVSMGCRLLLIIYEYLPFPYRPITSMGDIFQ